jgi:hypothetical protein
VLSGQRFGAANVASRHMGGIYNNRSVVGQPGAETPFVPVPRETQEQALDVLDAALFGPDAFAAEEAYLPIACSASGASLTISALMKTRPCMSAPLASNGRSWRTCCTPTCSSA